MDLWGWFSKWRAELAADTSPLLVDAAVALGISAAVTAGLRAIFG